jgi:hypothetical protein
MIIVQALQALAPNAEWSLDGDELIWLDSSIPRPTDDQIASKVAELEAVEPLRLLRLERDKLIAETDWWVLPDRTPTQAQLDYRQALRDITDTYTSLEGVVWPVRPQ